MSSPQAEAQGKLADTPLFQLLIFMLDRRLSGGMVFESPEQQRSTLTFANGVPVKSRVESISHQLGEMCIRAKLATRAQVDNALARETPTLIGERLVATSAIKQEQLDSLLREQTLAHITWLSLQPKETRYAFYPKKDFLAHRAAPPEPPDALAAIWQALPKTALPSIAAFVGKLENTVLQLHPQSRIRRFKLPPSEQATADVLRAKPQTLAELRATELLEPAKLETLIFVLALTRHLALTESGYPLGVDAASSIVAPPRGSQEGSRLRRPGMSVGPATRGLSGNPSRGPSVGPAGLSRGPSVGPAGAPLTDATQLAAEADAFIDEAEGQNYYELLNVGPHTPPPAVQSAFFQLAKKWHPDKLDKLYPGLAPGKRSAIVRIFARMTEAHQILTNVQQRADYDRMMAEGANTEEEQQRVQEILRAATLFQKAEVFAKRSNWSEAETLAKQAVDDDSEQPEYKALHAWVVAKGATRTEASDYTELLKTLSQAVKDQPNNVRIRSYRAQVLQLAGLNLEAMRDYKAMVEQDPHHIDAQRQLRLHKMRKDQPEASPAGKPANGGLFGGLFKKK